MTELGVNIDHVATIRQARGTPYPDPVEAARLAEDAGATGITVHLREDRRHIQERDVRLLRKTIRTKLNLEMAAAREIVEFACSVKPEEACLVPEKRQELTTEGGLDVVTHFNQIKEATRSLQEAGIRVSLFIDPIAQQILAAKDAGAEIIEIHTGTYADCHPPQQTAELARIAEAASLGIEIGLAVNAGHGLHYENVQAIARIPRMGDLNIGHSIVARALFVGFKEAVSEMLRLIREAS
jgi:pyridoxine 5-phosphate synthase